MADSFSRWDRSRRDFQELVAREQPTAPTDKWQKLYYRGLAPVGDEAFPAHQTKLKVKPFKNSGASWASPYKGVA